MSKRWIVRKPGHGETFEKRVLGAISSARAKLFPHKDNSQNSGSKESVGR